MISPLLIKLCNVWVDVSDCTLLISVPLFIPFLPGSQSITTQVLPHAYCHILPYSLSAKDKLYIMVMMMVIMDDNEDEEQSHAAVPDDADSNGDDEHDGDNSDIIRKLYINE